MKSNLNVFILLLWSCFSFHAMAQELKIAGEVFDEEGVLLAGVTVGIKDTNQGTITDFDGHFQLDVPSQNSILVFSSMGFKTLEVTVGSSKNLRIVLETDTYALDEVVAIGYGRAKKKDLSGSIATVEGEGLSQVDLKKIAKYQIKPYLAATPGVSDIAVIGGKDKEYQIELKPYVIHTLGISIAAVTSAVVNSNILQSNGYASDYNRLYLTLTDNAIDDLDDLRNLVIINSPNRLIRLKDIAEVKVTEAKSYTKILANGKNVPLIAVIKQPNANLVEVNNTIEKKVRELESILPKGVKLLPYYKQADFVNTSISSIKDVLWIGLVLALLVVILFLRSFSASMVVLFTIPLSLSLTLIVLDAIGYTFNIMTLGAIAAAIGLMIDDVVIIVEQVHKIKEEHPDQNAAWWSKEAIAHLFPAMVGSSLSG